MLDIWSFSGNSVSITVFEMFRQLQDNSAFKQHSNENTCNYFVCVVQDVITCKIGKPNKIKDKRQARL